MTAPLRILVVEDSAEDCQLLVLYLQSCRVDFTYTQVDTLQGCLSALASGSWDLVISDFSLPGTDGIEVLRRLRELDPDLPFILLSGVLEEGAAVDAMRAGANDFLLKGNLSRLVPIIEREMKEATLRRKHRQFQEELRLLHSAIGQTPDLVLITDPAGTIVYANAAAEGTSGYSRGELLGQNPRIFKSDRHDAKFFRGMWDVLLHGDTWKGHIVNRRKNGVLWDAEAVISPVFNAAGELQNYLCTAKDSTLERQLKEILEQSQRLETIGTLTSGIAHDFNNILMPLMGHAELGLQRAPGDPKVRHDLEVIQTSANRARDLIRQILSFSRKDSPETIVVEPQILFSESLALLRATVPSSIAFEVELDARGGFVLGDPTQLHQVVLNLCTNASHAMRGRAGRLTVKLKAVHLPVTSCVMNVELPEGDYLTLEVTDTGRGIPPEHFDKIFLPFFTTKPSREGTGLGLSVCHGIVSGMGGGFQVSTQLNVGTTFLLYLPRVPLKPVQPVVGTGEVPKGWGRMLLVDDEETLLEALHASLTQMGFQVSSYRFPELALAAFLDKPGDFQVMVTDYAMPVMSGAELAQAIWAVDPGFPVILLTGDPESGQVPAKDGQPGFRACLAKPMSPRDIVKVILETIPKLSRSSQQESP